MERLVEDAKRFLAAHRGEFLPVTDDRDLFEVLEQLPPVLVDRERIGRALETLETKVFLLRKPESGFDEGAKKVLLTASEPLAQASIGPMIERFRTDRRVRGIGLMTDNVAGRYFSGALPGFMQLRCWMGCPVYYDAMRAAEDGPFDAALVTVDPRNSPNAASLYGAKSVFGARRLYFLATSWVGVGSTDLFSGERARQMDEIDAVFVNDALAGRIIRHQLPGYPIGRIITTGTPIADSIDLRNAGQYTRAGREKLGLSDDETAVLVTGHISPPKERPQEGIHSRISEHTFELTFAEMARAAEAAPGRKFALVVRPHPRDPNKEELLRIAHQPVPGNLRVIAGPNDVASMQEAAYGTDATASIVGTDNFLAPMRGRQGIFLAYEGLGMGGDLLKQLYGEDIVQIIGGGERITVCRKPEDFCNAVFGLKRAGEPPADGAPECGDSIGRIADIILNEP